MRNETTDTATGGDPVAVVQGMLDLRAAMAYAYADPRHFREVAVGLLVPALGSVERAAELLDAAEAGDRPTGARWLADLAERLRPGWVRHDAIQAAHRVIELESGGLLTVTANDDGTLRLVGDDDPRNDYVRPARLVLTREEGHKAVAAILGQPGMGGTPPRRPVPLEWRAVSVRSGDLRAASTAVKPDGVVAEVYAVTDNGDGGWELTLEQTRRDEAVTRVFPLGGYPAEQVAQHAAQRFEDAGLRPLDWHEALWTEVDREQRAVSTTRVGGGMASAYYHLVPSRDGGWEVALFDLMPNGEDGGGVSLGRFPDEAAAKAYAQVQEIAGLE